MKIAFFSTTPTDKKIFSHSPAPLEIVFFESHLNNKTKSLAQGYDAVCVFVNDKLDAEVLTTLKEDYQINLILLRCAGFNNVDIQTARHLGLSLLRVPAYSPHAVAEHAIALMMTLNRKTHKAYNRIRENNFALEGLLGFDLYRKKVGVIGTGRIGQTIIPILQGFGMEVMAYDPYPRESIKARGVSYLPLEEVYQKADILTLHVPLLPETRHMINAQSLAKMKDGVMIINTSRGGLMDTPAVVQALKQKKIGYLGIDVYEQEDNLFFADHSDEIISDDVFERLTTFPNVLITAHQAFYTREALDNIRHTTLQNALDFINQNLNPDNCVLCDLEKKHE